MDTLDWELLRDARARNPKKSDPPRQTPAETETIVEMWCVECDGMTFHFHVTVNKEGYFGMECIVCNHVVEIPEVIDEE